MKDGRGRLPVVDEDQKLVGLIGLGDLARAAAEGSAESGEFVETFAAVSRTRKIAPPPPPVVVAESPA